MPLTVRTNGSGAGNIIQSQWFNDYYNLLTGSMQDQEVSIKNLMILSAIGAAPTTAPTLATAAGTSLGVGLYKYVVTFANADGETMPGPVASITTTTSNTNVVVSNIPLGPTGCTKRYIYRTTVGGGNSIFYRDNTLNDNTTTSYTDSTSDTTLLSGGGTPAPTSPTFGGSLLVRDSSGVTRLSIASDGILVPNKSSQVINGSVAGSAQFFAPIWGPGFKVGIVTFANYNSANNAQFSFPSNFTRGIYIMGDMGSTTPNVQWLLNGANISSVITTGLASGGGSGVSATSFHQNTVGTVISSTNTILFSGTSGGSVNTGLVFIGT